MRDQNRILSTVLCICAMFMWGCGGDEDSETPEMTADAPLSESVPTSTPIATLPSDSSDTAAAGNAAETTDIASPMEPARDAMPVDEADGPRDETDGPRDETDAVMDITSTALDVAPVQAIMDSACTMCHGAVGTVPPLVDIESIIGRVSNTGRTWITAGSSADSYLFEKLNPNPSQGSQMPLGPPLSDEDIATVGDWIDSL